MKRRPPTLDPDPIESSALDPGRDLAPGCSRIGTCEDVCAKSSDEELGAWDLRSAKACEEWGA